MSLKKMPLLIALILPIALFAASCGHDEPTPEKKPTRIEIKPANLTLKQGETAILTFETDIKPEEIKEKTWKSENPAIASVGEDGKVTATGVGETTILLRINGAEAKCPVAVQAPESPSGNIKICKLVGYDSSSGKGTYEPLGANTEAAILQTTYVVVIKEGEATPAEGVTWASGDPATLDVRPDEPKSPLHGCQITGLKAGKGTVTAKLGNDIATLTVNLPERNDIFLQLYRPAMVWGSNFTQIEAYEKAHHGVFEKQEEHETSGEHPRKYTVYTFRVNAPSEPEVQRRAYLIYEDTGMQEAFSIITPSSKAYNLQKRAGGWFYAAKDEFVALFFYAGMEALRVNPDGSGYIKGARQISPTQGLGIEAYPNAGDLDGAGKCLSVVLDFSNIISSAPAPSAMHRQWPGRN